MVTDSDRTSNGRLCPFCPVESFEHVQNLPPDGTDINGHHRTRNGFTGLEMDIKRIQTDTNGLKKVLSVTHPLARCDRNFMYRVPVLLYNIPILNVLDRTRSMEKKQYLSHVRRKPASSLYKNKAKDQLCSTCAAA